MTETIDPHPPPHLHYLDSARGIAAVIVMTGHYVGWQYEDRLVTRLLGIAFSGSSAVSFFFVLSGFVLSYKYMVLGHPLDVRRYAINRVFRLWPAFFVTILLNSLYGLNKYGITPQSLKEAYLFDKYDFWEEAIIFWSKPNFYGPGWSLEVEMGASLFLPFIIIVAKKDVRHLYWMALVALVFGNSIGLSFILLFIAGVVLSCLFSSITAPSFRHSTWFRYRYLIIPVAVLLYSLRPIDAAVHFRPRLLYLSNYTGISFFTCSGLAAFVFIVAILSSPAVQRVLRSRFLLFLGRISYGIYLMHWLLNSAIYFYKGPIMTHFSSTLSAFLTMFALYAAGTIVLATLIHYTVELPFIRLGKRITGRLRPSLVIN